jgi:hypothetical protein
MKVIKAISFTSGMLLNSTATESVAAYNAGTTYPEDAEVNYANSIYVSLQNSNTGNTPDTSPTWWIRKSANNEFSMFDEFINTQTTATGSLDIELDPGEMFNSMALFNLTGIKEVELEIKDGAGGTTVYGPTTFDLDDTIIVDWYMYFFEPYDLKEQLIVQGLPPYTNAVAYVTFTGDAGIAIGNLVVGNIYILGKTQFGASGGIRDYSVKEANQFGITTFVERPFSDRLSANVYVENSDLNLVRKVLKDIRAKPSVWIATDEEGYELLTVFGYYRDFNIEIPYPNNSLCRLEVEGIV